jgi:hypothetical protein
MPAECSAESFDFGTVEGRHVEACGFRRLRPGIPIERGHAFRSKAATCSDKHLSFVGYCDLYIETRLGSRKSSRYGHDGTQSQASIMPLRQSEPSSINA